MKVKNPKSPAQMGLKAEPYQIRLGFRIDLPFEEIPDDSDISGWQSVVYKWRDDIERLAGRSVDEMTLIGASASRVYDYRLEYWTHFAHLEFEWLEPVMEDQDG